MVSIKIESENEVMYNNVDISPSHPSTIKEKLDKELWCGLDCHARYM